MDDQIKLARAMEELQAGRTAQAQGILVGIVKENPGNADAWLALASCFDDSEKKEFLIQKALSADPNNAAAQSALAELSGAVETPPVFEEVEETPVMDFAPTDEAPVVEEAPAADEAIPAAFIMDEVDEDEGEAGGVEAGEIAAASAFLGAAAAADEFVPESPEPEAAKALDPWDIPAAEEPQAPTTETYPWEIPADGSSQERAPWEYSEEAAPAAEEAWTSPEIPTEGVPIAPDESYQDIDALAAAEEKAPPRPRGRSIPWYEVWLLALFSPSQGTWAKLLADPNARAGRGLLWVFVTGLISFIASGALFSFRAQSIMPELTAQIPELAAINPQMVLGYGLIGVLIGSPIMAGLMVLGVMISAGLYQLVAKFLIGEGTFGEMTYALSAIFAPIYLISTVFSLLTIGLFSAGGMVLVVVNIISGLFGLYAIYLQLAAIRGVNRFGWGASCGTFIAVPILMGVCGCVIGLLLMGSGTAALQGLEGIPAP